LRAFHVLQQDPSSDGYSRQITAIAAQQGGHIERGQLRALGLTEHAIAHLIARRSVIRVLRGVYAVGHIPTASVARAHAPLLAVGDRSALAGWSATNNYQHASRWAEPFTVITPLKANPIGVNTLHSCALRTSDIWIIHGLRTVSPALAVLQVAPDLSHKRMIRLIDDFRINLQLTHADLIEAARRFPRGAGPLRTALSELQPEPTRSSWEQEWPAYAARHDLPSYEMNVHVLTYRVDILFDGLIVMLDGWHVHGSRHAFEHDREEMAEIMAATGLPVLRITHRQFHARPQVQADRIKAILARRG
jgi:very-short-patch-repair endonuclease